MSQYYGANSNIAQAALFSELEPGFSDGIDADLGEGFFQQEFAAQLEQLKKMFMPPTYGTGRGSRGIAGIDGDGGGGVVGSPPSIDPTITFSPSYSTPNPPSPPGGSEGTDGTDGTATDEDSTTATDGDTTPTPETSTPPDPSDDGKTSNPDTTSPNIGGSDPPLPTIDPPWPPKPSTTSTDDPESESVSASEETTTTTSTPPPGSVDCVPIGGGIIVPNPPTSFQDLDKDDCPAECPCCQAEPPPCCVDAWADCITLVCLYHKEVCGCSGAISIQTCGGVSDPGNELVNVGADCCQGNDDCEICLTTNYGFSFDITNVECMGCWILPWCAMTGAVDTTTCKPCCDGS